MAKIPQLPKGHKKWDEEDRVQSAKLPQSPIDAKAVAESEQVATTNVYDVAGLNATRANLWLAMESWTEEQASMLLCGIDPLVLLRLAKLYGGELELNWPLHYDSLVELLRSAIRAGTISFPSRPQEAIRWADGKGLRLPAELGAILATLPATATVRKIAVSRELAHRTAILNWLESNRLNPLALPPPLPGFPDPIKQQARRELAAARPPTTPAAFDKAWKALRKSGEIRNA